MDIKIVRNAPKGATHYHEGFGIYFKFIECSGMADAYICGEWQDYPLYPTIRSLKDIELICNLELKIDAREQ